MDIKVTLTPQDLAKQFWEFDSEKQADFFESLAEQHNGLEFSVEMQYLFMRDAIIERGPEAIKAYQQLSVWAFDFLNQKQPQDWEPRLRGNSHEHS